MNRFLICFFLICVGGLSITRPLLAGGKPIGANVQVTDASIGEFGNAEMPAVAALGDTVYAAWVDDRDYAPGGILTYAIYFAKSTDGGVTWGPNTRLSDDSWDGYLQRPSLDIAADGTVWVTWLVKSCYTSASTPRCGGENRNNDIRIARSTDGGASWSEGTILDGNDDIDDYDNGNLVVDRNTGNVYIALHGPNGEGFDIYVRTIDVQNNVAKPPVKVSEGDGNGRAYDHGGARMGLTAANGTVCIAWEDRRDQNAIYGSCSMDGGQSFAPNRAITGADAFNPHLALAPDGGLYATYQRTQYKDIMIRRSADKGATWGEPHAVNQLPDTIRTFNYDLAVDSNHQIAVLWPAVAYLSSRSDLYLSTSINQGQSFAAIPIEDEQGNFPTVSTQFFPALAVAGSGATVRGVMVWHDDRNTRRQIWSARADLDGTPPTAPTNLRAEPGDTSVALTWNAASDNNGIQGYHVLRSPSSDGPYTQITPLIVTATTYRDVGLTAGTYFYQVIAVDGTGNPGPPSNPASATAVAGTDLSMLNGTIAYRVGGSLRLRDLPGLDPERTVGPGLYPYFSTDGQRIYYYQAANAAIFSNSRNGDNQQNHYTTNELMELYDIAADPNYFLTQHKVHYFLPELAIGGCDTWEPRYRSLNPDQVLYGIPYENVVDLALAADRAWLVYRSVGKCTPTGIISYSSPNFCIVNLTTQTNACEKHDYFEPDFAPNSHWLAFAANFSGQRELWKARLEDNGVLTSFTQLTRSAPNQPVSAPGWSSDGNWIVFNRDLDPGQGEELRLFAVRADGDGLRALNVTGADAAWFGGGTAPTLPPDPAPTPPSGGNEEPSLFLPFVTR